MRFRHHSEKVDELRTVPIFAHLKDRDLQNIAQHADEVESTAGQVLVRQGEVAHELIIFVDGSARIERDGKEIARVGPGDFVGEMALLDGKPRSATVITEVPGTLLLITGREFSPLLDSIPGLARHMLVTLCGRLRDIQTRFID